MLAKAPKILTAAAATAALLALPFAARAEACDGQLRPGRPVPDASVSVPRR